MSHILPDSEGSIYVYSNSRDVLDGHTSWNGGTHQDHIHPQDCWGLRRGRAYSYGKNEIGFPCIHSEPHDDKPYICFPIQAHGETVGLMHLKSKEQANSEAFWGSHKLAQMCAEQISMAIANVRLRDELQEQSIRDPLTNLFNRRHSSETMRNMIQRASKSDSPISVISIDVDHFKKFNDNHGHDAGDMVLRAVGSVLDQACDRDEMACRIGGEEFLVILPDTDRKDGISRAEIIRKRVEDITVRYGDKTLPHVTISLGLAIYPEHGTLAQDLIRTSDDALYRAKAKGRNRLEIAGMETERADTGAGKAEDRGCADTKTAAVKPPKPKIISG